MKIINFYFLDYWGGWACFVTSILMIGALTALVGDLASHFGCWIGLKDAVTAISFVAIGTSVPGNNYLYLNKIKINYRYICFKSICCSR